MTMQVQVSERAEREADEIYRWIAARSPDGAIRWYETYLSVLRALPQTASGDAVAPEADELGVHLRQRHFKTRRGNFYRLVFVVLGDVVHVLTVRSPGQDLLKSDDIDVPD